MMIPVPSHPIRLILLIPLPHTLRMIVVPVGVLLIVPLVRGAAIDGYSV